MSTAKERMLSKIRHALKEVPDHETPQQLTIKRDYQLESSLNKDECVQLFAARVGEYKADVKVIQEKELADSISESLRRKNINKIIIPPGIPKEWMPEKLQVLSEEDNFYSQNDIDSCDGVLTGCKLAIANTGTIALDGGSRQGRRVLTLLPDYHLCIVFEKQIVGSVPEAYAALDTILKETGSPVTFISGPSATSDIELNRVEGVHGPRRLDVLIVRN